MPHFQIRKCERYTNWEATNIVDLNPEEFLTIPEFPYKGDVNSEKDFVEYIHELYMEDWYEICDQLEASDRTDLACLLYTSPSPRDRTRSRMPSSA